MESHVMAIRKTKSIEAEIINTRGLTEKISTTHLIISNKSDALNVFYKKKKKLKTTKWQKRAMPTHYPFSLHLVVSERCLPEKMAHHVLLITDENKSLVDCNLILLEKNMPEKEKKSAQGKALLVATVFLPADKMVWARENLKMTAECVLRGLDRFLPFLREHIKAHDIDKSIDLSMKYRSIANAKYKVKKSFFSGFAAQKNHTSVKNVYLCGASLLTDAGCWDGEILSGLYAVYSVLKKRKTS